MTLAASALLLLGIYDFANREQAAVVSDARHREADLDRDIDGKLKRPMLFLTHRVLHAGSLGLHFFSLSRLVFGGIEKYLRGLAQCDSRAQNCIFSDFGKLVVARMVGVFVR
jgi:hypothetical protein